MEHSTIDDDRLAGSRSNLQTSVKKMTKIYLLIAGSCIVGGILVASALQQPTTAPTHEGMVRVVGGTFVMGTNDLPSPDGPNPDRIKPDEYPAHEVELNEFWLDETPVTNRDYLEFTEMTGYVTFAEKTPTREDFARSGADVSLIPEAALKPGSMCFNDKFNRDTLVTEGPGWEYQVWAVIDGASWRHPNGPESSIEDRMEHPVVHVNWDDAVAYCEWAGKRLPTEAEFEYASRNGGEPVKYFWGNERDPAGNYMCNYWQGEFPTNRLNEDGYETTSPVKSYQPNKLGLYDMGGNVWEWCSDYYHAGYYEVSPKLNPQGPLQSFDPREPGIIKRVQRGGSFMCNTNSCTGYRSGARMAGEITSGSFHGGFRTALDESMLENYQIAQAKISKWRAQRDSDKLAVK